LGGRRPFCRTNIAQDARKLGRDLVEMAGNKFLHLRMKRSNALLKRGLGSCDIGIVPECE
jgi:hypothetical protein